MKLFYGLFKNINNKSFMYQIKCIVITNSFYTVTTIRNKLYSINLKMQMRM